MKMRMENMGSKQDLALGDGHNREQ
jgi:hypothetical protein